MTFSVDATATGANYPPIHPNCRCTTIPADVKISSRAAKDPVTGKAYKVDGSMSFAEENESLQEYVQSLAQETVDEYVNLTQHTVFTVFGKEYSTVPLYESGVNKVATALPETYTRVIDYAVAKTQLGLTDYYSAIRDCVKALAKSGIRTADYPSGRSVRVDAAVRQLILWGIKQCNQKTADMVGKEFGADGYEISYHSHPRPSHEEMGGRSF